MCACVMEGMCWDGHVFTLPAMEWTVCNHTCTSYTLDWINGITQSPIRFCSGGRRTRLPFAPNYPNGCEPCGPTHSSSAISVGTMDVAEGLGLSGTGTASPPSANVTAGCWCTLPGIDLEILGVRCPGGEALISGTLVGELCTDIVSSLWGVPGTGVDMACWSCAVASVSAALLVLGDGSLELFLSGANYAICCLQYSCCAAKLDSCCCTCGGRSACDGTA